MTFDRAAYMREYRAKNKNELLAYQQAYEELHKIERHLQKRLSNKTYRAKHQKEILEKNRTPKRRFQAARYDAKRRDIDFNLSFEYWLAEVNKTCHYCRDVLGKRSETTVGLDRLDNSRGYVEGNVVSCCAFCNLTRGDRMTSEEMMVIATTLLAYKSVSTAIL